MKQELVTRLRESEKSQLQYLRTEKQPIVPRKKSVEKSEPSLILTAPSTQPSKQINYVQYDILRKNRNYFDGPVLPESFTETRVEPLVLTGHPATQAEK